MWRSGKPVTYNNEHTSHRYDDLVSGIGYPGDANLRTEYVRSQENLEKKITLLYSATIVGHWA
jgi:hypothetical protein